MTDIDTTAGLRGTESRLVSATDLADLPEGTLVRDRMGDVGEIRDGHLLFPETSPQTFERAAKKYAPFTVVARDAEAQPGDAVPDRCPEHDDRLDATGFCVVGQHTYGEPSPASVSDTQREAPETGAPRAIQWAPSGNVLDGVPGEMMRFLAGADGTWWGYGGGPGAAMTFGIGPFPESIDVLPGQWVVRHDDGTFTVQDDAPAPVSDTADADCRACASCGDDVGYLSSRDRCDGCEAQPEALAPVSDTRATVVADDVKLLRETLCEAQTAILNRMAPSHALPHADRLQALVAQLDVHRPLGPDGKHGDRHTATCGCDDVPVSDTRREEEWVQFAARAALDSLREFGDHPTISYRESGMIRAAVRALLAAHPAPEMQAQARICPTCHDDHTAHQRCTPAPVSDTRREDVARALFEHDQKAWPDSVSTWETIHQAERDAYLARADAVLAVLPAPPDAARVIEIVLEHDPYLDETACYDGGCMCPWNGTEREHEAHRLAAVAEALALPAPPVVDEETPTGTFVGFTPTTEHVRQVFQGLADRLEMTRPLRGDAFNRWLASLTESVRQEERERITQDIEAIPVRGISGGARLPQTIKRDAADVARGATR